MESGIEDSHLGGLGHDGLAGADAHQVGGVVEGAQGDGLDIMVDPVKGVIASTDEIAAVGHRVLHGGMAFTESCIIDDACSLMS